jgi:hypothetical protein
VVANLSVNWVDPPHFNPLADCKVHLFYGTFKEYTSITPSEMGSLQLTMFYNKQIDLEKNTGN